MVDEKSQMSQKMRDVCAKAIELLEASDDPLRIVDLRENSGLKVPRRETFEPFMGALGNWDNRVYDSRKGYVGLNDRHELEDD